MFEAIDWSIAITRGNRWRVFGLIVVLSLINLVGLALAGIGVLFTMGITVLAFAHAYTTLSAPSEYDLAPTRDHRRATSARTGPCGSSSSR